MIKYHIVRYICCIRYSGPTFPPPNIHGSPGFTSLPALKPNKETLQMHPPLETIGAREGNNINHVTYNYQVEKQKLMPYKKNDNRRFRFRRRRQ